MLDINELKFDEKGLIPAVVVDAESKNVLTVAYMNKESLEISIKEGKTCFWSRSRQELWTDLLAILARIRVSMIRCMRIMRLTILLTMVLWNS